MKEKIKELSVLLSEPQEILIITHPNPDGDAFGSVLALSLFLKKYGHKTTVVSPTNFTKNFYWLPGIETLISFEAKKDLVIQKIAAAKSIFCLDFNALSRIEEVGSHIASSTAVKVMVDHHQMPEDFAAITFSDTKYAATCEYLYDIMCELGKGEWIDKDIALNLYTGLATDTGFFNFNNTTEHVHSVAGALISKGVSPDFVQDKVFNIFREERLRYFGYCLLNSMKLSQDGNLAYIMVSKEEAAKFHLQSGDNEGLVNFPFKIEGVMVSVLFTEEVGKVKISFRSKDRIDVNSFARQYFEGGGHINAAGGKSKLSLLETESLFLSKAKELFENH